MQNPGAVTKVLDYYFMPKNRTFFGNAFDRAKEEFFGNKEIPISKESTGGFAEWFLFDFLFEDGRTPLQYFYDINPLGLSSADREVYKLMQDNEYGMFEIKEVRVDEGITLSNIQTGKTYNVEESTATHEVESGHVIVVRVVRMGEKYEIAGGSTMYIPMPVGELKSFSPIEKDMEINPKIIYEIMNTKNNEKINRGKMPNITDLDLSHAGVEMTRLENGKVDMKISYEGPSDESYDGCPVCKVLVAAREKGVPPNPEEFREAIEQMMREKNENEQ